MYKNDLALNNLQWFICHKSKPKLLILQYLLLLLIFIIINDNDDKDT